MALPAIFHQADGSSANAQKRFLAATGMALGLAALAALLGVIEAAEAGWLAAIAFVTAIVVGALAVTRNLERTWYDGRALAESAKSLAWLFSVRGGDLSTEDEEPERHLKMRLRAIRDELSGLDFVIPAGGADVTDQMRVLRAAPLPERRATYLAERVDNQVGYYTRRAGDHERQATRFRGATWAAQAAGVLSGAAKGLSLIDVDLLGIAAALAAGFTAWIQTRDHVTLARAFRLTGEDLERVKEDLPPEGDEAGWAQFVADAEAAMSREHVMWLARRGRRPRG